MDVVLVSTLPSGDDIVVGEGIRFGRRVLNATGILPKGRHRLLAEAFTESVSSGDLSRNTPTFDLEFQLTPVPEPGTLGLVLLGGIVARLRLRVTKSDTAAT